MPRQSIVGAASNGSFGFALAGRPGTIAVSYLVVGGAGGGNNYGGGGGGYVSPATGSISTKISSAVVVGAVGGAGSSGGTSSFNGTNAVGGYGGSPGSNPNGGGQSGNGQFGGSAASGSWPAIPFPPWTSGGSWLAGGGGGGFAGSGGAGYSTLPGSYYCYGGDGGSGVPWSLTGEYFGGGGGGGALSISNTDGQQPNAYGGAPGAGFSAFAGDGRGGVIVSYVYPTQLFTGGTVTSTGTFPNIRWFHRFSSSGTLAPAP